jgi:hypothetical protein
LVQFLLRLVLHAVHELFCMKCFCMRYKVFSWGCQIYSVTLIVVSGFVVLRNVETNIYRIRNLRMCIVYGNIL